MYLTKRFENGDCAHIELRQQGSDGGNNLYLDFRAADAEGNAYTNKTLPQALHHFSGQVQQVLDSAGFCRNIVETAMGTGGHAHWFCGYDCDMLFESPSKTIPESPLEAAGSLLRQIGCSEGITAKPSELKNTPEMEQNVRRLLAEAGVSPADVGDLAKKILHTVTEKSGQQRTR